jgi:hypothetical protein
MITINFICIQKNPSCFKRKPRDKDLGRLATYLVRETATSLASRLRIYLGLVEADRAAQRNLDESNRRLYILYRWRGSNGSENLEDLIDLLTVTKDYQMEDLQNLLEGHPKRRNYGSFASYQVAPYLTCVVIFFSGSRYKLF